MNTRKMSQIYARYIVSSDTVPQYHTEDEKKKKRKKNGHKKKKKRNMEHQTNVDIVATLKIPTNSNCSMKNPSIYNMTYTATRYALQKLSEIQLHTCESLLLAKCSTLVDNDDIFVVVVFLYTGD